MPIRTLRFSLGLSLVAFSATSTFAHTDQDSPATSVVAHGKLVPAKNASPEWLAKAKADYPTDSCVVSDDNLEGDMGKPQDFIYKEAGQPDRLVRFCCKDCQKDFNKNPQKYLNKIDQAAAKKNHSEQPAVSH